MSPVVVGVSLKAYFGRAQAREWMSAVAEIVRTRAPRGVEVFVIPTYLQLEDALAAFAGTGVRVGAQDVSEFAPGAYTGEVTAAELADSGVELAEIGHAERRRLFGETDAVTARKATMALAHGVTPVLCIGETERTDAADAAAATVAQLHADLDGAGVGRVIVAYEPVWAIGAPEPAPAAHVTAVARALREALDADAARAGSAVIYGGSAGPGLLTQLGDDVDGLFLGRFAHDPAQFAAVLDEAVALAATRSTRVSPTGSTPTPVVERPSTHRLRRHSGSAADRDETPPGTTSTPVVERAQRDETPPGGTP